MRIEPEGAALTFVARLACENGWSAAYADAVFGEYRRFLYLAATSDQPVTPSEDVDQAWHLHLGYSRHYRDVLCGQILGRALHHEPTAGGRDEAVRHHSQYEATLWLYGKTFESSPRADIWPNAGTRFAARPQWVDRARYWLVPKALTGRAAGLAAATALLGACTMFSSDDGGPSTLTYVLAIVSVLVIFAGLLAFARFGEWRQHMSGRSCSGSCGGSAGGTSGDGNGCGGGGGGGGCGGGCGG
ncbi:glycine-rich domain-containing protein [Sphingosinicella sp.]|uniref:glycine-rich domain-containing protein n=1 Tax=Sphingosinicella sp. TaxID=1917971 RepID=UPI004037EE7A